VWPEPALSKVEAMVDTPAAHLNLLHPLFRPLLVRVTTEIDERLEPEVRYRSELTIPQLSNAKIPIP